MSLSVVLRPEAQADLLAARDWYDGQQPGLGDAFADAVEEMLARIGKMPGMYAVALKSVRRGKLRRFPNLVYDRVFSDRVEIIGVLHGSQDPQVWQRRA